MVWVDSGEEWEANVSMEGVGGDTTSCCGGDTVSQKAILTKTQRMERLARVEVLLRLNGPMSLEEIAEAIGVSKWAVNAYLGNRFDTFRFGWDEAKWRLLNDNNR